MVGAAPLPRTEVVSKLWAYIKKNGLQDKVNKRLVNADSQPIPNGPNGEVFDAATHTHYDWLNSTAPTEAALLAAINDVVEHGHGGQVRLNINQAAETAVRGMASFVASFAGSLNPASTTRSG